MRYFIRKYLLTYAISIIMYLCSACICDFSVKQTAIGLFVNIITTTAIILILDSNNNNRLA